MISSCFDYKDWAVVNKKNVLNLKIIRQKNTAPKIKTNKSRDITDNSRVGGQNILFESLWFWSFLMKEMNHENFVEILIVLNNNLSIFKCLVYLHLVTTSVWTQIVDQTIFICEYQASLREKRGLGARAEILKRALNWIYSVSHFSLKPRLRVFEIFLK